MLTLLA